MADLLAPLLADGIVEDVISRLKTGKEAELFIVQHSGEICAAKVYKERHARNFKNNAAYKEGRTSRNSRTQRAMDKGTRFGQRQAEEAWKAKEFEALTKLHALGVRVPQPILMYEGVLLMEVVIDPEGHPAPRLIDAPIAKERAVDYYVDLRGQMIRILMADLIHGDLSPYNVLLAWNGPTIIDFPQVVGAAHNTQAKFFFQRDMRAIHQFFCGIDPALAANSRDADEIWHAYERRELTADFVPTGRNVPAVGEQSARQPRRGHAQGGHGGGGRPQGHGAPRGDAPHAARGRGGGRADGGSASSGGAASGQQPGAAHQRGQRGGHSEPRNPGLMPAVTTHGGAHHAGQRHAPHEQSRSHQGRPDSSGSDHPQGHRGSTHSGRTDHRHGHRGPAGAQSAASAVHSTQPHRVHSHAGTGDSAQPQRAHPPGSDPAHRHRAPANHAAPQQPAHEPRQHRGGHASHPGQRAAEPGTGREPRPQGRPSQGREAAPRGGSQHARGQSGHPRRTAAGPAVSYVSRPATSAGDGGAMSPDVPPKR